MTSELGSATSAERSTPLVKCGHQANGNGVYFECDRAKNHKGLHQETVQLREGPSRTNWGDDGLAPHATRYPENGTYGQRTKERCSHGKRIGFEHCNRCQLEGFCDCAECRDHV